MEREKVEQSMVRVGLLALAREDLDPIRKTSVMSLDENLFTERLTDSSKH